MLAVKWESVARLRADGIEDMLHAHWRETSLDHDAVPLAPDWRRMEQLEEMGLLRVASLRRGGELIGYSLFSICTHLQFALTLHATNMAVYVKPRHRGLAGARLLVRCEELLDDLGIRKRIYLTPVLRGKKLGALIARLGYTHTEDFYSKLTG
jgi:GNAT superfamily N-acetyltransferase